MPHTPQPLVKGSEAHVAKQRAMANLLLGAIPPDMPHSVLLEALLSVYIVVAEKHPCCTGSAGLAAFYASQRLEMAMRANERAGAPVH